MNSETLTHWYKEGDYYFLSDNTELRAIRPWGLPIAGQASRGMAGSSVSVAHATLTH